MNAWTVVLAVGFGSYLLRMSMIGAADRIRLPASLEDSGSLVAPAAFAALAVTGIGATILDGTGSQALAPLAAVTVAALAVLRTGSRYAAMLAGMPTLWVVTLLTAA